MSKKISDLEGGNKPMAGVGGLQGSILLKHAVILLLAEEKEQEVSRLRVLVVLPELQSC